MATKEGNIIFAHSLAFVRRRHSLSFSVPKAFGPSEAPARPQGAIRAAEAVRMHPRTNFMVNLGRSCWDVTLIDFHGWGEF